METTTVRDLAPDARVLVTRLADGTITPAAGSDPGEPATVRQIEPDGRKRRVETDLGAMSLGPTAHVRLASGEQQPSTTPTTAVVTLDAAWRLTAESVVIVGERMARVPSDVGVPTVASRIDAGLRELGFCLADGPFWLGGPFRLGADHVTVPIRPLVEES